MSEQLTADWRQVSVDAARLAETLLGDTGDRWQHALALAARAESAAPAVPAPERELLVAAAWLHDVGYARSIADSGFHPLDGAHYLAALGAPSRLVGLVAHHSCARFEAAERGLSLDPPNL